MKCDPYGTHIGFQQTLRMKFEGKKTCTAGNKFCLVYLAQRPNLNMPLPKQRGAGTRWHVCSDFKVSDQWKTPTVCNSVENIQGNQYLHGPP